jgi:hypothetical protein
MPESWSASLAGHINDGGVVLTLLLCDLSLNRTLLLNLFHLLLLPNLCLLLLWLLLLLLLLLPLLSLTPPSFSSSITGSSLHTSLPSGCTLTNSGSCTTR